MTPEVPFNDELPVAPETASDDNKTQPVDAKFDADFMFGKDVPKLGDHLPIGKYHFRADRFFEGWQEPDKNDPQALLFGRQPYFNVIWSCQQEPHTGLRFADFVNWVSPDTYQQAKAGNPAARAICRERLQRARTIMEECEYKGGDFKEFLNSHPECYIQVGLRPKKVKVNGELKDTGELNNNAIKYESLRRPRS